MTSLLGAYRLLGLVGQGQFAQVYCAVHRRTGQLAAIKQSRHAPESASQESLVLAKLSHPNLVQCHKISQTPTGYQFVLEYCEGGTLRSHLTHNNPLSFHQTKSLITDILKGLSYLHQKSVTHNDLKPENIFLTHTSNNILSAKVGDFGHARFIDSPSHSRHEIGSPYYAAPERFSGESSFSSDLYAVGIMLYEMLLGDRPFSGSSQALCQAHQTQSVPLSETLPRDTQNILATALHKQPDCRFKSADAMLTALQYLQSSPKKRTRSLPTIDISQEIVPASLDFARKVKRPLLTSSVEKSLEAIQVVTLNARYQLKIHTLQQHAKTHLDCFTRRGKFVGRLSLNTEITQTVLSYEPYQLIATTAEAQLLLITLKPFHVGHLTADINTRCMTALPWGYIVSDGQEAIVFDRSANAISRLTGLPLAVAIAPLNSHTLLIATEQKSALFTLDLKNIDLGIIF